MRVIFYAEPASLEESQKIKKVPDFESEEARWVTVQECRQLDDDGPGLRGDELLRWASYLEKGGQVFPLALFGKEGHVQGHTDVSFQLI